MPASSGTGVIIGRFQIFQLDPSHLRLIESVQKRHKHVVVFLGSSPAPSDHNPLHVIHRQIMFAEVFGEKVPTYEMPDLADDRVWSQELDRRVLELRLEGPITLYGSQEEMVERYSGRYPAQALTPDEATLDEEFSWEGVHNQRDFRVGAMFSALNRFPTVYPTVDIAVFKPDYREVLLARKENENKFRFPGGFVDPSDESYEMAAIRELMEECGELEVDDLVYLGSCRIDDWRYRGSSDGIMTHLYACVLADGEPTPDDDITELRWFDVERLTGAQFVAEHRVLFEMLEEYLREKAWE